MPKGIYVFMTVGGGQVITSINLKLNFLEEEKGRTINTPNDRRQMGFHDRGRWASNYIIWPFKDATTHFSNYRYDV